MSRSSARAFFITDDAARQRAFVRSSVIGVVAGLLVVALGWSENVAAAIAVIASASVFTIEYFRYASIPRIITPAIASDRRPLLKLALVGVADWALQETLSTATVALAFAGQ